MVVVVVVVVVVDVVVVVGGGALYTDTSIVSPTWQSFSEPQAKILKNHVPSSISLYEIVWLVDEMLLM